jgi:hypothetical protein
MAKNDMQELIRRLCPWTLLALVLGLAWTLFINGAVPWLATPTVGQAASMLGYAQSFADQHWYTLHARSFGFPVPAALATGLPLAVVAGWFLRTGLASADAYSAAAAIWLIAGFLGAWLLACRLGVRPWVAGLAAATWMSMPMVWGHQGYSSLAMGMGMLPLYVWSSLRLFSAAHLPGWSARVATALIFMALCIIALFMDGYTFMMFAVAAALGYLCRIWRSPGWRRECLFVTPVYVAGFAGAYALYTAFVGRSAFDPASLDSFRGWGVDLLFLAKPTAGELWVWDSLGWARERSQSLFYGDASVWTTTFAVPLAVAALACLLSSRLRDRRVWPWLLIAAFGIYMALGPTIKLGATKPAGMMDTTMPASAGGIPTGNAVLSEHVPGFRNMRAAYRWEALFLLGLWAIVALRAGRGTRDGAWAAAYVAIVVFSAPGARSQWTDYTLFHRDLNRIDHEVAMPLALQFAPGSKVFFAPWTNDIVATYVAPKAHITTYNISGDKQMDIARAAWPAHLASIPLGRFDASDAVSIRNALLEREADAIVVPFFDGFASVHIWPCVADSNGYSAYQLSLAGQLGIRCPAQLRASYAPSLAALAGDTLLEVNEQARFATIRLRPEYAGQAGYQRALAHLVAGITLPLDVIAEPDAANNILHEGWHGPDPTNRWSMARASVLLPISASCMQGGCVARLTVSGFAASPRRPVALAATVMDSPMTAGITMTDGAQHVIEVPLPGGMPVVSLRLDIPQAASPAELGMSSDPRVLGVSLFRIEMGPK